MTLEHIIKIAKTIAKPIPLRTTSSAPIAYIYCRGRRHKAAFTSSIFRLRPQRVAASAARPRQIPFAAPPTGRELITAIQKKINK